MKNNRSIQDYEDIIHLPHPTSPTHPRMSPENRAAQFSPFAALTGHEDAIREAARLTDEKKEPDEYTKEILNRKLQILLEHPDSALPVTFTFFVPDEKKEGGTYQTHTGMIQKIDRYQKEIILTDHTILPIEQIQDMESQLFSEMDLPV